MPWTSRGASKGSVHLSNLLQFHRHPARRISTFPVASKPAQPALALPDSLPSPATFESYSRDDLYQYQLSSSTSASSHPDDPPDFGALPGPSSSHIHDSHASHDSPPVSPEDLEDAFEAASTSFPSQASPSPARLITKPSRKAGPPTFKPLDVDIDPSLLYPVKRLSKGKAKKAERRRKEKGKDKEVIESPTLPAGGHSGTDPRPVLSRYDWRLSCTSRSPKYFQPWTDKSRPPPLFPSSDTSPSPSIENSETPKPTLRRSTSYRASSALPHFSPLRPLLDAYIDRFSALIDKEKEEAENHAKARLSFARPGSKYAGKGRNKESMESKGEALVGMEGRWTSSAKTEGRPALRFRKVSRGAVGGVGESNMLNPGKVNVDEEGFPEMPLGYHRFRNGTVVTLSRSDGGIIGSTYDLSSASPPPIMAGGNVNLSPEAQSAMAKLNKRGCFSEEEDAGDATLSGTVAQHDDTSITVVFEKVFYLGRNDFRLDFGFDGTSFERQQTALQALLYDPSIQRQEYEQKRLEFLTWGQNLLNDLGSGRSSGAPIRPQEPVLIGTEVRDILLRTAVSPSRKGKSFSVEKDPSLESNLFTENQLINSWVRRHLKRRPMQMDGDPDLGLNDAQTRAIAMMMSDRIALVQGPPGTGKSRTIIGALLLLKHHFQVPQPILVCAPTNVAVDHLLSSCINAGLRPLRIGQAERVREDLRPWVLREREKEHPLKEEVVNIDERIEKLRKESAEIVMTRLSIENSEGQEDDVESDEDRAFRVIEESGFFAEESLGSPSIYPETPILADDKARIRAQQRKEVEFMDLMQREAWVKEEWRKAWRDRFALQNIIVSDIYAASDVFLSTCIGCNTSPRNGPPDLTDFPVVFIDEAAMCTEPMSLIPLTKGASHINLIGDHKQLPAVIQSREAAEEGLSVSLFERLMMSGEVRSVLLDTQYRMHPDISSFPNHSFYHAALQDSTSVSRQDLTSWKSSFLFPGEHDQPSRPVTFIHHDHPEVRIGQSFGNPKQADIVCKLAVDLLSTNGGLSGADIGIISPYAAQSRLISEGLYNRIRQEGLNASSKTRLLDEMRLIEVNTVDGFQGREKSIIVLSCVRSNSSGTIGFLADLRRLNVAMTRARHSMFVVGNAATLKLAGGRVGDSSGGYLRGDGHVWTRYLEWLEDKGMVTTWNGMQ